MKDLRLVAIVLIVLGLFGLAFGSFSYVKDTHGFHIGSLEVGVKDRETVDIPLWLSVGALVAGGVLLLNRRGGATI
jgi:TRAP-type C4-dicarboxylate transport system permease small subunit